MPLVKAVQELSGQNKKLKSKNDEQKDINAALQKQIDDLKSMIVSGNQSSGLSTSSQDPAANIKLETSGNGI